MSVITDGSAMADAHEEVVIDRDDEPYRWVCPNGHCSWDRTNNHCWCPSCARQSENGVDVHPEHWEIVDEKTGQTIPYAAVRFAEDQ
ncbi:hypothetical protein [Haloarcula argentinensis]|uniref:RanBP2-type domain-containing protein n=1 Tax=Haloarcula argentinensis TaxID=43776 RepID=A0ABU2F6E5_HALAR|nr:hypothetical protein [Haloarcula argentinensis]MDS0256062.1 hypothetical protein [Haloarcula argentinensis]